MKPPINCANASRTGRPGLWPSAPREFTGAHIALVGDRSPVLPALARALHRAGVRVRESAGPILPGIGERRPDLVFLDLGNAPLDGLATAQALRHRGLCGPLLAVFEGRCPLPTYACFNAGIDDLLELPLDDDTLWGCLTRWLQPRL